MSYKAITHNSYEKTAREFSENVRDLAPYDSIEKMARLLPEGGKILDLGCGSGRDAKIFSDKGFDVLGIDFSAEMIAIAKKTAPLAQFQVMDIEQLSFPAASFHGAWASSSLLHLSKKSFEEALKKIYSILAPHGYFYIALKAGQGETIEKDFRYGEGEHEKFWAYYSEKELRELLIRTGFDILDIALIEKKHQYQTHASLRAFCQKNKERLNISRQAR